MVTDGTTARPRTAVGRRRRGRAGGSTTGRPAGRLLRAVFGGLVGLLAALGFLAAAGTGPAAAADWVPDARLSLTIDDPGRPIVAQEMVLARVAGLYRVPITLEKLVLPEMPGFRVLQIGPDRWSEVMADGLPTRRFERLLALYPQAGGRLTIPPIVHRLTIVDPQGRRIGHDLATPPTPLVVAPPPPAVGTWWLPARSVTVTDAWSVEPEALAIGQSTRRTVTVVAEGVTDDQLPATPDLATAGLIVFAGAEERKTVIGITARQRGEALRQRLDRPGRLAVVEAAADGPIATVTYTWSIRPTTDQPALLPDIEIPWFDTATGQPRRAILPGRSVALKQAGRSLVDLEADLGLAPVAAVAQAPESARTAVAVFALAALAGAAAVGLGLGPQARRRRRRWVARRLALWSRLLDRLPGVAATTRWRASDRADAAARAAGLATEAARLAEAKARAAPLLFGPQAS